MCSDPRLVESSSSCLPLCERCGGQIGGRRRNGFCSDRCRMADRREQINERRRGLLSRLKGVVGEVEAEWFPKRTTPFDE
jgi:hypothetical protein